MAGLKPLHRTSAARPQQAPKGYTSSSNPQLHRETRATQDVPWRLNYQGPHLRTKSASTFKKSTACLSSAILLGCCWRMQSSSARPGLSVRRRMLHHSSCSRGRKDLALDSLFCGHPRSFQELVGSRGIQKEFSSNQTLNSTDLSFKWLLHLLCVLPTRARIWSWRHAESHYSAITPSTILGAVSEPSIPSSRVLMYVSCSY